MWQQSMFKKLMGGGIVAALFCLSSCSSSITQDLSFIPGFHREYFAEADHALSDTVDLYVDYSTCVAEAKNSNYYKATHPAIVDSSPVFYSIKGKQITRETDNRQQVYQLLSTIHEVNHADIKAAVNQIVNSNNQAVLITDGEYFMSGAVRDNLNNPYLAEEFRQWLAAGHDIYIYSEPYLEKGKYSKFRYYMLFTDAAMPNNINDKFSRSAPADCGVKMLHLSNGVPALKIQKDNYPDINQALSPVMDNCKTDGVEIQEYGVGWGDIHAFLDGDELDIRYVFRGLFVDRTPSDCYRIDKIKAVVSNVYEGYQPYCDSLYAEGSIPAKRRYKEVKGVFDIDEDLFEETGEIALCLDREFDGVGNALSAEYPNLLKVDFVISEASDNFSNNPELCAAYKWNSISAAQGHAENTSIYESISQVIKDPQMNPAHNGKVIYTMYLSTFKL
ncbi:MAG: hypothetical protein ACI3ZQ_03820 [Candidatus Cryptobacteroides sp.]